MKRIILFLIVAISMIATQSKAQGVSYMTLVAGDTLTNTDTVYKYINQVSGGVSGIAISPQVNKISGTSAGKVYLYESLVPSGSWGSPIDSMTLTDIAVNSKVFHRTTPVANYYMLQFTSSGTVSAQLRVRYSAKVYQITN